VNRFVGPGKVSCVRSTVQRAVVVTNFKNDGESHKCESFRQTAGCSIVTQERHPGQAAKAQRRGERDSNPNDVNFACSFVGILGFWI
jgi:hypothetical protein